MTPYTTLRSESGTMFYGLLRATTPCGMAIILTYQRNDGLMWYEIDPPRLMLCWRAQVVEEPQNLVRSPTEEPNANSRKDTR